MCLDPRIGKGFAVMQEGVFHMDVHSPSRICSQHRKSMSLLLLNSHIRQSEHHVFQNELFLKGKYRNHLHPKIAVEIMFETI